MALNKIITMIAFATMANMVNTNAQMLTPQAINPAGQYSTNGNMHLEGSLGGLVVQDVSNTAIMYTPDFLQPFAGFTTSIPVINNVVLNSGSGVDNGGTTFTGGNLMLEFTVGESASITLTNIGEMITQGILQPYNSLIGLPVTGLVFTAHRISSNYVELNWKTLSESNNRGFHIERKQENENSFTPISFFDSKGAGGNSNWLLDYSATDTNMHKGKTWYRLKQEDIDGRFTYSVVRMVNGSSDNAVALKAWPVPAVNNFTVMAEGIENDVLMIFDVNGKIIQQVNINNGVPQLISNLSAGTYILRLRGNKDAVLKVLVVNGH